MGKQSIEPSIILTIDIHNFYNIPFIITNSTGEIQLMTHIEKSSLTYYKIRKRCIEKINSLCMQYPIDTIIIEQNKLFIDKIDRYPDPIIYRNILLGFGIQISIEDNFYETIKYILELPNHDWTNTVLNSKVKYSIDLYKSHVLLRDISENFLNIIEKNNYYKAICLSESTLYSNLMNKKYQINKGDR